MWAHQTRQSRANARLFCACSNLLRVIAQLRLARVVEGAVGRDIPGYQRHGADHHIVTNADVVGDDAAVGPQAHVVADAQRVVLQPQGLDPDRAVLANEEVAADAHMAGYHHTGQVSDAQAGGDLCADVDINRVLQVQALLHPPGMAPGQAAASFEELGQAKGEEKAQFIVLAGTPQNIEKQAGRASWPFLVGDFHPPTFEQVGELHTGASSKWAHHDDAKLVSMHLALPCQPLRG